MGANNSKSRVYEAGFRSVKKWGVGLTICIGTYTPYIVFSIKAIEPQVSFGKARETRLETISSDTPVNEPEFLFIMSCIKKEDCPVDKHGKIIPPLAPNSEGEFIYKVHLKPLIGVNISTRKKKSYISEENISKIFAESEVLHGGNESKPSLSPVIIPLKPPQDVNFLSTMMPRDNIADISVDGVEPISSEVNDINN